MRFKGILKTWNDDRGFGFIEPNQGGEEIFVHIKAFGSRGVRPQAQQPLSYEIEFGPRGKRARNVEFIGREHARNRVPSESHVYPGTTTLFAIPAFVIVFVVILILWEPPLVLAAVYLAASLIAYLAYARDKTAARSGGWRTKESTLHLLALAGGWPGALLAQQLLRHKSSKADFRSIFWVTVVVNVVGFVIFCSPIGQPLWARV